MDFCTQSSGLLATNNDVWLDTDDLLAITEKIHPARRGTDQRARQNISED